MHALHGARHGRERTLHDGLCTLELGLSDDPVGLEVGDPEPRASAMTILNGSSTSGMIEIASKAIIVLSRTFTERAKAACGEAR